MPKLNTIEVGPGVSELSSGPEYHREIMMRLLFVTSIILNTMVYSFTADISEQGLIFDPSMGCSSPGSLSCSFNADDLYMVNAETPVYLKIRFASGATLCQTLVDIEGSAMGHHPIYLALYLETTSSGYTMNADPGAVSIIRWREGESEIWLKFSEPTTTWLSAASGSLAPGFNQPVSFNIGHAAMVNAQFYSGLYVEGKSNRQGNGDLMDTLLKSTHLCLSFDGSFIATESKVGFYTSSYIFSEGVSTIDDINQVTLGDQIPIRFTAGKELGVTETFVMNGELDLPVNPGTGWFFPSDATGAANFELSFHLNGDIPFYQGSQVVLEALDGGFALGPRWTHPNGEMGYLIPGLEFQTDEYLDSPGFSYALDRDGYVAFNGVSYAVTAYVEYDGSSVFPLNGGFHVRGVLMGNGTQPMPAQISMFTASQPYAYQPGSGSWSNTQFYCPAVMVPMWSGTEILAELVDFGPNFLDWPRPSNIADLLGLMEQ